MSNLPTEEFFAENCQLQRYRTLGFWPSRWFSFCAALAGVRYVLRTQPNAWIECAAVVVVILAGWWLEIALLDWGLLSLTVGLVLAMEAINTSIEAVVDLVSPTYHPLAKIAKDAAAGALVIVVLASLFIAATIFLPRVWALFI